MLIKTIDEIILAGKYDVATPQEVEVILVSPTIGEVLITWNIIDSGTLNRNSLHYNDIDDGGNKYNRSWQDFFAQEKELGSWALYNGSSTFFKNGTPNFGGVGKSLVYLRYSAGFNQWLASFDPAAAAELKIKQEKFSVIPEGPTKKLPVNWQKPPKNESRWPLMVAAQKSDGKYIVLWLGQVSDGDRKKLESLHVDVDLSRALMAFLTPTSSDSEEKDTEKNSFCIIDGSLQMGSGLGRNAFGIEYKSKDFNKISISEFTRLYGGGGVSPRNQILEVWGDKLEYRMKFAPNPDKS